MRSTSTLIMFAAAIAMSAADYTPTSHGVALKTGDSNVEITFINDNVARVVKYPADKSFEKESLSITAQPSGKAPKIKSSGDNITLASAAINVIVNANDGTVSFTTPKGAKLLSEQAPATFTPYDDAGRPTYTVAQSFTLQPDEEIFGLGILQNGKMSQRGENRDLFPGNTEDGIPFFQSIKGYGLYWDNYSTNHFSDTAEATTFSSEVGDGVDYYFIYGGNADGVIAQIREISGDVPMAPLWTYGFHQSKERYKSQDETVGVLHRYRAAGIPIDCMIQDWQYWGNNYMWNAMEFMNEEFPDPAAMMAEIHGHDAHCLISIWSSFGPMTKPYRQLDEKGYLMNIETWPQSGISHIWPPRMDYPSGVRVYDCYSPEARDIYWNNLKRLYDLGLDGWWMDSTEPDHFNWKKEDFDYQTGLGSYRSVRSAYPLMTVGGVYDHQLDESQSKRPFILTRSCTFGQQRYGSNTWSGDVVSTWDMLRKQIPAGLNFSLTGNPNFNSDLGGFFAGSYNNSWKHKPAYENPAYRELYVRWTQQGIFTPMMRSHGADVPREFYYYGVEGEPVYDALVDAVKLRYRLLPYTYSLANEVSKHRGTFMRALAMDFANDRRAVNTADEYMYGRSLLVAPVVKAQYTPEVIRKDADANAGWDKNTGRTTIDALDNIDFTEPKPHTVYLPAGASWYNLSDGELYDGGRELEMQVALRDIPVFVKAGSIIPLGPDVQYTSEKPWDNLDILVYPGADAKFTLYEDAGDGLAYKNGSFTEIPFYWNQKSRTLTIGEYVNGFEGMLKNRTFNIVLPDGASKSVAYNGKSVKVKF